MTPSPFNYRQRNERVASSAICASGVLPVGRPVVVCVKSKNFGRSENRAAIKVRYYPESAPGHSSRRVSGNWAGMKRCFPISALPALFCPGTGGTFLRGVVNSCAAIGRHYLLLRALLNALQKPSRRLTDSFHPLLFAVRHEQQRTTGAKVWRTQIKGISNP